MTSRVFALSTVPGLEDLAAAECAELIPGAGVGFAAGTPGAVRVETPELPALLRLSTIHHVLEVRAEGEVETPEDVRAMAVRAELPELADCGSFRVTASRVGEHPFSSVDLQQAAGGALHTRYGTAVDLKSFQVEVHVNVYGDRAFVGLRRTDRDLGKRIRRARALRSSLKPTVAAAMLRLVGAHEGRGRLLDPMCGAGTIPLEARRANPELDVRGADWDPETVEVARQTLANHGEEMELRCVDARRLVDAYGDERFDYLVTDPPYGVRQARRTGLTGLYGELLPSFEAVLAPGGRLALVVVKPAAFRSGLEKTDLIETHRRVIDLGGLQPHLVVLKKNAGEKNAVPEKEPSGPH